MFGTAESVVRWMGAMQAQDYAQALWAVAVRMTKATVADVERTIVDGRIVRTWPMRGTIHFVPAADARWMLALSAPRMLARDVRRLRQLEIDGKTLARAERIFQRALSGGKRLSRSAMLALLTEAGIPPTGQRGYHILWHAAQTGLICLGPMTFKAAAQQRVVDEADEPADAAGAEGAKEQTFVLLDEWAPGGKALDRDEALARLARRYFTGHGPATVRDFAWWGGLSLTDARAGIAGAKPSLQSETIEGVEFWLVADQEPRSRAIVSSRSGRAHLLPAFDEYLIGYADRRAVLAAAHVDKIVPGGNGIFMPTIIVDGQVVGIWRRTFSKRGVEVSLLPFKRAGLRALLAALAPAAERFAAFLGRPLASFTIGTAKAKPPVAS
ncbi:MAG TPA: winged helix DNA-binding domain-containing protein [Polyangia bacterium]